MKERIGKSTNFVVSRKWFHDFNRVEFEAVRNKIMNHVVDMHDMIKKR